MMRPDDRLDSEIQHRLDLLAADYEARGMSPEEARLAARCAWAATRAGLPVHMAAERLGVSRSTVKRWRRLARVGTP